MAARIDWSRFSADPRAHQASEVRACDADRDAALAALAEAFADGRLNRDEHDERSDAALAAITLGELRPLLQDLEPNGALVPRGSPADRAVAQARRESKESRNGLLFIGGLTTIIWAGTSAAAGELLFFWPVFPIGVLAMLWIVQLTNRSERVEKLEQRYARRDARRLRRQELRKLPKPRRAPREG